MTAEAIVDRLIHPSQENHAERRKIVSGEIKEKRGLKNNGGLM
jgi:hypothetical protein